MKTWLISAITILMLTACGSGSNSTPMIITKDTVTQDDIAGSYAIEFLSNETYYFPAKHPEDLTTTFQALERFDIIFVGHNLDSTSSIEGSLDLALAIPGTFTHIMTYIGKDSDGFAYAVEMNTEEGQNYTVGVDGMKVDGQLYIYCLGSDFGLDNCPKNDHIYGIETYDYMWAKQLEPNLKKQLIEQEDQLISTIKEDLQSAYSFQLPFHIGLETTLTKVIPIVDDGRQNGADCTAYVSSLFEEVAGVCLDEIRMNAAIWESYYLNDPLGQQAILPEKYNVFSEGDIYLSEVITTYGYSFVDNIPRQTLCSDGRVVTGMPTPDLFFNSSSMIPVQIVEPRGILRNY